MTNRPRFIMLGGFLGAGKTTTIAKLARHFQDRGTRVGIVTNDQATDLVDTNLLRSQGFDVGEVAGSCFCCNFNELTATVERLGEDERPEVILAEPVGSCTDLVATVIRPLQQIYSQPLAIAPYGVIMKPSHGSKILRRVTKGGFSPQAAYIFRKQLEEADFLILNRIDELSLDEVDALSQLIRQEYPETPCIRMSAVSGEGFDNLCEMVESDHRAGMRWMDVDYEIYAEGEAELGWLNAQLELRSQAPFSLDDFLIALLQRIQQWIVASDAEVAHLKAIGMSDGNYCVANLVNSSDLPRLSIGSNTQTQHAEIVVNARIAIDPETLEQATCSALQSVAKERDIETSIKSIQSFRPGKPVPTHRLVP
jgi:G3E family GTPase